MHAYRSLAFKHTSLFRGSRLQLHPSHFRTQQVVQYQKAVKPTLPGRRYVSTESGTASAGSRLFNFFYGTTLVLGLGIVFVYLTDTRASVHRYVVIPTLRLIYRDPEEAHQVGNKALRGLWAFGLHPRERGKPDEAGDLEVEVFGTVLKNPIATSAGIDKHADIPDPLFAAGPAIVELGGTTPLPQPGNEKPRVFRLTSQNAMINRYGLNSEGADHIATRLQHRVRDYARKLGWGGDAHAETQVLDGHAGVPPGSLLPGKLLAINIAKNKSTPENDIDAVTKDYVYCAERLAPYADILVVNVSSPNTPGLRSLQNTDSLNKILSSVVEAAHSVQRASKPAVMVKVSPDEDSDEQIAGIAQAVWNSGVDGVIVGNTTNSRPKALKDLHAYTSAEQQHLLEQGGFSGPHLFDKTVAMVKKYKSLLDKRPFEDSATKSPGPLEVALEKVKSQFDMSSSTSQTDATGKVSAKVYDRPKVIFATGGITNGKQALEILNAGASVAMVYTALVYGGIGTISRIKDEMRQEIKKGNKKNEQVKA